MSNVDRDSWYVDGFVHEIRTSEDGSVASGKHFNSSIYANYTLNDDIFFKTSLYTTHAQKKFLAHAPIYSTIYPLTLHCCLTQSLRQE